MDSRSAKGGLSAWSTPWRIYDIFDIFGRLGGWNDRWGWPHPRFLAGHRNDSKTRLGMTKGRVGCVDMGVGGWSGVSGPEDRRRKGRK